MTDLAHHWREHLRLSVLRVLEAAPGYSGNESLLTDAVQAFGFRATRDQVKGELAWLRDNGLIGLESIAGLGVATINQRGLDVAAGNAAYPGIQRPAPKG